VRLSYEEVHSSIVTKKHIGPKVDLVHFPLDPSYVIDAYLLIYLLTYLLTYIFRIFKSFVNKGHRVKDKVTEAMKACLCVASLSNVSAQIILLLDFSIRRRPHSLSIKHRKTSISSSSSTSHTFAI